MKQCTQQLFNPHLMDINPILAGWSIDWEHSPRWDSQRRNVTLYYIRRGNFTLVREDGSYPVGEGNCFFLPMEDRTAHTIGEPGQTYDYMWVGFTGSLSHGFAEISAPFRAEENQLVNLKTLQNFI